MGLKIECDERLAFCLPSFSPCSPIIPQVFRNGLKHYMGLTALPQQCARLSSGPTTQNFLLPGEVLGWDLGRGGFIPGSCVCSIFGMSWEGLWRERTVIISHPESLLVGDHRFHQPLPECSDVSSLYFCPLQKINSGINGYLSIIHLIFMEYILWASS